MTLMQEPCPPSIDFYSYFILELWSYPGDRRYPVDPAQRRVALLQQANIVIFEENEANMMRSNHGPAFLDLVENAGR